MAHSLNEWEKVKLGDVAKTATGGTPSRDVTEYYDGEIPWVKSGDLNDGVVDSTTEKITQAALDNSNAKIFPSGTLMIALYGATVGKLGKLEIDAATNQAVCGIFLDDNINRNFLFYFLLNERQNLIARSFGGAQPNISQEIIRDLVIPLPPLPEQRRIAALLDKSDHLRRTRRYAAQLSDTFLQAVFVRMFGDARTNPMGWDVDELGNYAVHISSGATPLGGEAVYKAEGIRFIRSQNVLMNRFDFSDIAYIDESTNNGMKRSQVQVNDVLLNITGASIGRVGCYTDNIRANVNQHVCIIRLTPDSLTPFFLAALIAYPTFQKKILAEQSGATRQAFNFEQIKNFNVLVPPLALKQKFARIVQQFERLRAQQREAERQAEHLFQTLLHRAFSDAP